MRAKLRLVGAVAVFTAGLAVAACGPTAAHGTGGPPPPHSVRSSRPAAPAVSHGSLPTCRTHALKWTFTLLNAEGPGQQPNARLSAVNRGKDRCVFGGYPGVDVHNGKANSVDGVGRGRPAPVTLPKGEGVTVDVRYTPRGTKGASDLCVSESEAVVRAPQDAARAAVPITDTRHKTAKFKACGETMLLSPPRHTPGT
ncbi:DUF4232 domain-containing protein [Streptantibioticus ferralitis]|uniref:DUF4232 domain-containing protein n=1 Tax=Streptantibioticus ferralitis TaxID=236510 RepID=A0ABT5YVP1_9ACTN|nr:DUF4232 domain-containing protein [Streptantibioticus ferralitis]MDF2255668.1 DUF4232 domain-containing protein [Streptantibioticus ferralitis]